MVAAPVAAHDRDGLFIFELVPLARIALEFIHSRASPFSSGLSAPLPLRDGLSSARLTLEGWIDYGTRASPARLRVSVAAFEFLPATAEARRALRGVFHAEVKFDFSSPRDVLLIAFCCLTFYCDLANTGDGVQDFITLFGEPEEFLNQRVVHQRQPSVVASDSFSANKKRKECFILGPGPTCFYGN